MNPPRREVMVGELRLNSDRLPPLRLRRSSAVRGRRRFRKWRRLRLSVNRGPRQQEVLERLRGELSKELAEEERAGMTLSDDPGHDGNAGLSLLTVYRGKFVGCMDIYLTGPNKDY